jgi:hypothetical protein
MSRAVAWPTEAQELLLRAALRPADEALAAWEAWSRVEDVESADPGSQRIFPLAYRTLSAAGAGDARLAKLKGVYRHAWYRNHLLFDRGARLVEALRDAGVETLLLKGAALATLYYRDVGARPMEDLDLLVHREDAPRAMDVIRGEGWTPASARPESRLAVWHADYFVDEGGRSLDLHWNALWQLADDTELWAGAVPAQLAGVETRALGHADSLLQVCVHGLRWAAVPPIRWVADAVKIVEAAGPELDWDRLVAVARANRLTLASERALRYLGDRWDVPVPDGALAALAAAPKPLHERAAYRAGMRRPTPIGMTSVLWERHRRLGGGQSFLTFVQRHAGVERRADLPRHLASRLFRGRWRETR